MKRSYKGGVGWFVLGTYVAAWDYWACKGEHETLSAAFGRAMSHKIARWPATFVTVTLLKHLLMPNFYSQFDPYNRIADHWRNTKNIHTIILTEESAGILT